VQLPARRTAHAKINLGLSILGKRSDGFHDIETVFCPISLADELTFSPADNDVSFTSEGISVPTDGSNLCVRAATMMRQRAGAPHGVHIHLRKNIPVGSGLGGGSSDAACVLKTLRDLWLPSMSDNELSEIALSLGADVPYFLHGGLAAGTGKGERMQSLPVSLPYWVVVVVPPVHVSTAWAYGALNVQERHATSGLGRQIADAMRDLDTLERLVANDFERVVIPAHPQIESCKRSLLASGLRCVRMSGSGSAVYGLTGDRDTAFNAAGIFSPPNVVSITPPDLT
jgi:4-diphosphocytidyl-2-C-methyl-D-erythritol kinase